MDDLSGVRNTIEERISYERELDLEEKMELEKLQQEEARISAKVAAHEAEVKEIQNIVE